MKNRLRNTRWHPANLMSIVVIGFMFAMQSPSSSAAECEKTVRWNDDVPYSSRNEQGVLTGFYVELVREALQKMGCSAKFVEMPWARALLELEAGRLDILPGALQNEQRNRFALFSTIVNTSPNVLFVAKPSLEKFKLKKLDDIMGSDFKLGVQINVSYGPRFDELIKIPAFSTRLTPVYTRRNGWKMLELGRIDGLIADEATGLIELQQLALRELITKSDVIASNDSAMVAFSKKTINAAFVDRFNKTFHSMIANGEYARIRERNIPCKVSIQTLACK